MRVVLQSPSIISLSLLLPSLSFERALRSVAEGRGGAAGQPPMARSCAPASTLLAEAAAPVAVEAPRSAVCRAGAGLLCLSSLFAVATAEKTSGDKNVFLFLLQVALVCFSAPLDTGNGRLCLCSLDSLPRDRSEFSLDGWGEPWLGMRIIAVSGCATHLLMISFKLFTCTVSVSSAVKYG